ncbi:MAG: hypothetical protein ACK56F_33270 [bacterium]
MNVDAVNVGDTSAKTEVCNLQSTRSHDAGARPHAGLDYIDGVEIRDCG